MANDDSPAGFLGRWSRRKAEVRQGQAVQEPTSIRTDELQATPRTTQTNTPPQTLSTQQALDSSTPHAPQAPASADPGEAGPETPAPTLDDVQSLTPESDYSPFMARGVTPDVKNAALKKLFTDPHFNVMDRMDVYIDDYGQPDPIPLAMLRQMNGAKFLNLFDEDAQTNASNPASGKPADGSSELMAQSVPSHTLSPTDTTTHDHADLRLQPDPNPRPEGAGPKPA